MLYAWLTLLSIAAANGALAFGARGTQNPFTGDFAGVPAFTKAFDKIKNSPIAPASQYNVDFTGAAYDDGLFTPSVESLSALSPDTFTRLEHPAYPHYSVRVKKSKFCDTGANAYTGYIDIEAKHIFFYFFESRSNPDKDDVILWTNGGPGCSSAIGLFMELGPCRVSDENGTHYNPYSWNENANVFFIDQPVGVGFSYAEHGEYVSTSEEAAVDIAAFVFIFFEHFSQFKGRPFHMSGESYGGRYLPLFASAVYDLNPRLVKAGYTPINLTSVLIVYGTNATIGNGLTDISSMIPSYYDMMCSPASVDPILDIASCTRAKAALPRCEKALKADCINTFDELSCEAAILFCAAELQDPFFTTGMNPYDISKECDGPISETLCYPITKHIGNFLSRNDTRKALGVDPFVAGPFRSCSTTVGMRFNTRMDSVHPTYHYVSALLERGVRVLVYVGEYDWICNWVGNSRWTEELEWSGGDAYREVPMGTWKLDGKTVGRYKSSGDLTFATIHGAGHMVPYDKPKESLEMLKRWLANESF